MNKKTPNSKDKIVSFLSDIYVLNDSLLKQFILKEKDISEEIEESAVKVKASLQSLKRGGILREVIIGYVPVGTVPASNAVFSSHRNIDCPDIGYKLTINKAKFERAIFHLETRPSNEFNYDSLNRIFSWNGMIHKFRKNSWQHKLFDSLWVERKHIKNNKVSKEGMILPMDVYAKRIGLATNQNDYEKKKTEFTNKIKGINKSFSDKGIPAHIERKNGIQLVITT